MPPRKTELQNPLAPAASAPPRRRRAAKSPPAGDIIATPPPAPSSRTRRARPFVIRQFSRAWMARFLDAAAEAADVASACLKAGVTVRDYQEARLADLAFDEACRVHDQVIDLRITDALRASAIQGDARSLALYFGKVRELVLGPPRDERSEGRLPSSVAEAMIRAGLLALDADPSSAADAAPPLPPRRSRAASPRRPEAAEPSDLGLDPDDQ